MDKRQIFFMLMTILMISGCQVNKRVSGKMSLNEAELAFSLITPISIDNATLLETAINYDRTVNKNIQSYPNTTSIVNFGSYISLAKVITAPIKSNKLVIESYVTSTSTDERYLFYPVISVFDNQKNRIDLIKPRYEFEFNDNVLTNHFLLPPETAYILIHSTPEFTGMSFTESNAVYKTSLIDPTAVAIATSVVTSVFVPATGNSQKLTPIYTDFILSNIGNIKIISP